MKKSSASKKASKATKRPAAKSAAKAKAAKKPVAKKPAAKKMAKKPVAKKATAKKPAAKSRKTARKQTVGFALDPRLMPCGCCPGACGEPMGGKRGAKQR